MRYASPAPNSPQPVRRMEKTSTTELKMALQKIKQTQLQVLKVLRSEAETPNLTQTQIRQMSQNIQNMANVNLVKIAEINQMQKLMDHQKHKSGEAISSLQQKQKLLQQELNMMRHNEEQLKSQKDFLLQKINRNESRSQANNSEEIIRKMTTNFQQQINQRMKERAHLESQIHNLQGNVKQITDEKQNYRLKYNEARSEIVDLNKRIGDYRVNKSQSINLPYDNLILEIKKLSNNHEKIYNNLKIRSRVTISDLDTEEQIQQSFSKILMHIENSQNSTASDEARMPDSTYMNEIKKIQNNMVDSGFMKKSIADLREENNQLKEDKDYLYSYNKQIQAKLKEFEREYKANSQSANMDNLKEYTFIIDQLRREMERIRNEKQELADIVQKLGDTPVRSMNSEDNAGMKILRGQLDEIVSMNGDLRQENEGMKAMLDGLRIQVETSKAKNQDKDALLVRQQLQKDRLNEDLSRYTKMVQEREINQARQEAKISQLQSSVENNMNRFQLQRKSASSDMTALRQEMDRHIRQNRDLREVSFRYQFVDSENHQLKQKLMHINSTIIHLWEIKEAQYSNIHSILNDVQR